MALTDEILNAGLNLAMEWGPDWLKPIQERLGARFPALSLAELDEANTICQAAMRCGHAAVHDYAAATGKDVSPAEFANTVKQQYSWVDAKNLSRLHNQGMYYAWKEGVLA